MAAQNKTEPESSPAPKGTAADFAQTQALAAEVRAQLRQLVPRARSAASRSYGGGGFKPRRSQRILFRALVFAWVLVWLLPVGGGGFYYGLVASDQYVTESNFTISGGASRVSLALGGVLGGGGGNYANYAAEYIESSNIIEDMRGRIDIASAFSSEAVDIVARLKPNASLEDKVDFWRGQTRVRTDGLTGQVTLQIRAFSPEDSLNIHRIVLEQTEAKINDISERMRRVRLQEAELAVSRARKALEVALNELAQTRQKHGVLDVDLSIKGYTELVQSLRAERTELEQKLAVTELTRPNAPEIQILQSRVEIVDDQIDTLNAKIASQTGEGDESLAAIAVDIGLRETDVSIARTELVARLADLEAATAEVTDQDLFVEINVRPSLPQEATYPERFKTWALIFAAASIAYAMVFGLGLLVRDNMG